MKIESFGKTLVVSGLSVLNVSNAGSFRDNVRASVQPHHTRIDITRIDITRIDITRIDITRIDITRIDITRIDIDMSLTRGIDSTGLGALVSLHRFIVSRQGQLRLINPVPVVRKVLDLTQLSKSYEITQG